MLHIYLRHIHVINEVDESLSTRWTEVSSSFLLKWLFQNSLQHFWCGVEIKRDVGDKEVFWHVGQLIIDKHSLASTRSSNQHYWSSSLYQHVHEVAYSRCFCRVNKGCLWKERYSHQWVMSCCISNMPLMASEYLFSVTQLTVHLSCVIPWFGRHFQGMWEMHNHWNS